MAEQEVKVKVQRTTVAQLLNNFSDKRSTTI